MVLSLTASGRRGIASYSSSLVTLPAEVGFSMATMSNLYHFIHYFLLQSRLGLDFKCCNCNCNYHNS